MFERLLRIFGIYRATPASVYIVQQHGKGWKRLLPGWGWLPSWRGAVVEFGWTRHDMDLAGARIPEPGQDDYRLELAAKQAGQLYLHAYRLGGHWKRGPLAARLETRRVLRWVPYCPPPKPLLSLGALNLAKAAAVRRAQ